MRVIFIARGLNAKSEKIRRHIRIWEDIDGMHPVDAMCKFVDKSGLGESHIIIFDGILTPYGTRTNQTTVELEQSDVQLSKYSAVPIRTISTRFGRFIARFWPYLIVIIIVITVVAFMALTYQPGVHPVG